MQIIKYLRNFTQNIQFKCKHLNTWYLIYWTMFLKNTKDRYTKKGGGGKKETSVSQLFNTNIKM